MSPSSSLEDLTTSLFVVLEPLCRVSFPSNASHPPYIRALQASEWIKAYYWRTSSSREAAAGLLLRAAWREEGVVVFVSTMLLVPSPIATPVAWALG